MNNITKTVATALLATTLAACSSPKSITNNIEQTDSSFAMDFFKTASGTIKEENFCISPVSAMWALSMSANGANGKTAKEMYTALGSPAAYNNREAYNSLQCSAMQKINNSKKVEVTTANSIWLDKSIEVKEQFKETNSKYYNAVVQTTTLSTATDEINNWCSNATLGKINNIVPGLPTTAQMVLVNAIYFKGLWRRPFIDNYTRKTTFRKANGEVIEVDMMKQEWFATYYEDEFLQACAKELAAGEYSMLFILPQEGVTTEEAAQRVAQIYDNNFVKGNEYMFKFEVPKFKIEFATNIIPTLRAMGIERAFTTDADFSGISIGAPYMDHIVQKNYISIDETGVEAAGATADIRSGFMPPPADKSKHMKLNRPFIFAIRENAGGTILFMGRVGNPNE